MKMNTIPLDLLIDCSLDVALFVWLESEHPEILVWLLEEQYMEETNTETLIRKLKKLIKMENQGY